MCFFYRRSREKSTRKSGFTLLEMLVATSILILIIGILFSLTQGTSKVWKKTTGEAEAFRGARTAFDALTRTLSQATLNTYYDYVYSVSSGTYVFATGGAQLTGQPLTYARNSDLEIASGPMPTLAQNATMGTYTFVTHGVFFQAPLGLTASTTDANLNGLLNACGFYVMYGPDHLQPGYVTSTNRNRYRLYQFTQPSEDLAVYVSGNKGAYGYNWWYSSVHNDFKFLTTLPSENFVLCDNVIALVILPKLSTKDELQAETLENVTAPMGTALAPSYLYDSATAGAGAPISSTTGAAKYPMLNSMNQMPPVFQVTMVAIDEASALKLNNPSSPPNAQLGITSSLFTSAASFATDLATLQKDLSAAPGNSAGNKIPMNFRVFQTDVAVRGAKWTTDN